jgi:glycosyltransferase involved in cell wall biosynthesis
MNKLAHILEVTKSTGGVGEYIRWLVHGLDKNRFRLTVACLSEGGPELAAELSRLPNVQAFSLAMNRYQIDPLSDLRVLIQLARMIRREDFDLIHAHTSKPGFLARLAVAGMGIPVIYRPACFAFHSGAGRLQIMLASTLERFAARCLTTRIMTVCNDERALARQYKVGRAEQFVNVYTGIDLSPFDIPVDRATVRASLGVQVNAPLIGSVGRLSPQKAPLDFVQAAALVHARQPDVHFVWVGAGPLEAQARALVSAKGLDDVFHFAGQRKDVPFVLRVFDCFALSSLWEGFSLSVLEAMAAGLPVVVTRILGTPEAVQDGVNGFLVPPGDPPALAQALIELLADPNRARQLGANGRKRIEQQFTRKQMLEGIERLYGEVIASRHPSGSIEVANRV